MAFSCRKTLHDFWECSNGRKERVEFWLYVSERKLFIIAQICASEPTDDGFRNEVKTVTIRIFGSHDAAELARSNLESHGIGYWVNADDCGGMYPNLTAAGGVRLLVRVSDAEAAIALLNAQASPAEINQIETEAVASSPPETVSLKKLAWGQILFGIVIGLILCLLYEWANNFRTKTYYHHANGKVDKMWVYRNERLA